MMVAATARAARIPRVMPMPMPAFAPVVRPGVFLAALMTVVDEVGGLVDVDEAECWISEV